MHIRTATPAFPIIALLMTACGRAAPASRWLATVDTVGDTVVVHTRSGGVWPARATLAAETSIGVLEGNDAYMLGDVRGLAVGPDSSIYVLDSQVPVLRKYGPDGRYIADFGREGSGPGEYRNPDGGLAVLSDGRVLVRDPGNARIDVFAGDGQPLQDWPLPSGGGFNTSRKLYTDTANNAYPMVLLDLAADVTKWRYGLARISPAGQVLDTVNAPTWDYQAPVLVGRNKNSSSSSGVPFSPSVSWTFSPLGYMVGGLSTDYRIDLFRRGAPVLRIERAAEPVPVTGAERSEAEERMTTNMRSRFPGWRWNGPAIPGTKPPFRSVFAGDDGWIWVVVAQPGREIMSAAEARAEEQRSHWLPARFREPVVFDVFEPDGQYLGRVDTPEGFSTGPQPVFRGDRVWAVVRDSLEVPHVTRFHVQFPVGDAEDH